MKKRFLIRFWAYLLFACITAGSSFLLCRSAVRSGQAETEAERENIKRTLLLRLSAEADGAADAFCRTDIPEDERIPLLLSHCSSAAVLSELLSARCGGETVCDCGANLYRAVLHTTVSGGGFSEDETADTLCGAAALLRQASGEILLPKAPPDIETEETDTEITDCLLRLHRLSVSFSDKQRSDTSGSYAEDVISQRYTYDTERVYRPEEAYAAAQRYLGSTASFLCRQTFDPQTGVYRFSCRNGEAVLSAHGGHLLHYVLAPTRNLSSAEDTRSAENMPCLSDAVIRDAALSVVAANGLRAALLPDSDDRSGMRYFFFCKERDTSCAPCVTVGIRCSDGAFLYYEASAFYRIAAEIPSGA